MPTSSDVPRVGMLARVRNRRGIVAAVSPYDGETGRMHLVQVDYKDHDSPHHERLLWELEPGGELLEPNRLPQVHRSEPMPAQDFDALLRAARWTALMPYLGASAAERGKPSGSLPISPLHSGIRVEDYQLVPLERALEMPRVNLLVADDVGLGKTVEAGLVLKELLLRRRIRRVLVLVPAALRMQWRDELEAKFALPFEIVDRARTERLRRELGIDASPWRSFNRIVASYHYLRQRDILEQFLAASQPAEGAARLGWDLLIVDECHNLMPSSFGDDSELCQMLRQVAPRFEHRLFLSATPHNGHTRSFTGLLEILDPVRFSQTDTLSDRQRARVRQLMVRRLKKNLGADPTRPGTAPRFCQRKPPQALPLARVAAEANLSAAFDAFRKAVRRALRGERPGQPASSNDARGARERAGTFAIEILGKRLLSCPTAFADSWRRARDGYARATEAARATSDADVAAAKRSVERETADDREAEQRARTAAGVVGAWLRGVADAAGPEMDAIDRALVRLGFDCAADGPPTVERNPTVDARFDALTNLIEQLLLLPGETGETWADAPDAAPAFRADERLVVFTEYKTTLDYLERRLRERYGEGRVLTLFGSGGAGGMDEAARNQVRQAFNAPDSSARILVATDAASEGLNLHRSARYLLHYDCPWNPSRLEQRNGRLDRYGQARDVTVHHFLSDDDPDLLFLDHVIRKADEIREDLGSVNELFDTAAHRRLIEGEDLATVQFALDHGLTEARGRAPELPGSLLPVGERGAEPPDAYRLLDDLANEIDFAPDALRQTLETAMAMASGGRSPLTPAPAAGTSTNAAAALWRLRHPDLPGWRETIDDSLRLPGTGAMPRLAFSPDALMRQAEGRDIFSPRPEIALLHLGHPMIEHALRALGVERPHRQAPWTARRGGVPRGMDALILLSLEELAVNELRETFHHWVRTLTLPVRGGALGDPLPHVPARRLAASADGVAAASARSLDETTRERARSVFRSVEADLEAVVSHRAQALTDALRERLRTDGEAAIRQANVRYRSRAGEVSELIAANTIRKLEREIAALRDRLAQQELFDQGRALDQMSTIEAKQREIDRRGRHYSDAREQLERDRQRITSDVLPKRHALAGEAQAFPVAIEVRLP